MKIIFDQILECNEGGNGYLAEFGSKRKKTMCTNPDARIGQWRPQKSSEPRSESEERGKEMRIGSTYTSNFLRLNGLLLKAVFLL